MKFAVFASIFCALYVHKVESAVTPRCNMDWIDLVWDIMVLGEQMHGEARQATVADLRRMFTVMDKNGGDTIDETEFVMIWKDCSLMTDADTKRIFDIFAAASEGSDRRYVSLSDVTAMWNQFFKKDILTKEEFAQAWKDTIMPMLPDRGCVMTTPMQTQRRSLLCLHNMRGGFF